MKKSLKVASILLSSVCLFFIFSCKKTPGELKLQEISKISSEAIHKFPIEKEIDTMKISIDDKIFLLNLRNMLINSSKAKNWSENELKSFERETYYAAQTIVAKGGGNCKNCKESYKLCQEGFPQGPYLQQTTDSNIGCATNLMFCILINCNYSAIFKQSQK